MSQPRPPRLAEALLARVVPRGWVGESVVADLELEFHQRAARSAAPARVWYCGVVLQMTTAYLWDGLRPPRPAPRGSRNQITPGVVELWGTRPCPSLLSPGE